MGQGALAVDSGPDFDIKIGLRLFDRPGLVRCLTRTEPSNALSTLASLGLQIPTENDPSKSDFNTPT